MFTQKLVLSYSTKILVQLVQMATSLIVARLVGPSVLGTLAFGLAYVNMFAFVNDLGVGSAHIKLISEGRNEKDCISTYATIKTSLIGLYILVVAIVFLVQKYLLNKPFESHTHEIVVLIYLIITSLTQLYSIATVTWAGKMQQAKQDIPSFFQTLLYQLLRVVIALLGYKAIALALGNLAAVLITIPFYIYLARDLKFGKFDKELFKDYVKIATPLILILICQALIYSTDKVILQSLTNSETLGFYAAAFTLASFIKTIETSTGLLLFPFFSKHIAESNYSEVNNSLMKFERFIFVFILPMGFCFSIFSDLIIHFTYGSRFNPTVPIFSIIVISFLVSLSNLPYSNILFGMGKFRTTVIIWITNLLFFLAMSYLFVSPALLNMKGVGMALSILLSNILMFIQLITYTHIYNKEVKLLQGKTVLIFAILFFAGFYMLISQIKIDLWIFKLLIMGFIYILYIGIGRLAGIIKLQDIAMILQLVNIKKMKTYISSEIGKKDKKNDL